MYTLKEDQKKGDGMDGSEKKYGKDWVGGKGQYPHGEFKRNVWYGVFLCSNKRKTKATWQKKQKILFLIRNVRKK